jgi:ADP-ribosylglycohydrolase
VLGHDTDTAAAIAGGLAGLYYGRAGMPAEWVEAPWPARTRSWRWWRGWEGGMGVGDHLEP